MRNPAFLAVILSVSLLAPLGALDWYEATSAGIALSSTSAFLAKRMAWSLSVEREDPRLEEDASPILRREVAIEGRSLEVQTLYRRGDIFRRVLRVLDASNLEICRETHEGARFEYELYDVRGNLLETFKQTDDSGGELSLFSYRNDRLEKTECGMVALKDLESRLSLAPLWSDTYRYLRGGELRSVVRVWTEAERPRASATFAIANALPRRIETNSSKDFSLVSSYDVKGRETGRTIVDPEGKEAAGSEKITYENGIYIVSSEDSVAHTVFEARYSDRGRLVEERVYDADKRLVSQKAYEWKNDKLAAIASRTDEGDLRVEYTYGSGDEVVEEHDYRDGNLERLWKRDGTAADEELYIDGKLIVRAHWEDDRKVSEERFILGGAGR